MYFYFMRATATTEAKCLLITIITKQLTYAADESKQQELHQPKPPVAGQATEQSLQEVQTTSGSTNTDV